MTIPPISLWQAFAVGIPLAIAGFGIQELILRRRAIRSPDAPVAPTGSDTREPASTPTVDQPAEGPHPVAASATVPATHAGTPPSPRPDRNASPWLPGLLELESDLDAAIEVVANFVDALPRMTGARACAEELDRLVPDDCGGPPTPPSKQRLGPTPAHPSCSSWRRRWA